MKINFQNSYLSIKNFSTIRCLSLPISYAALLKRKLEKPNQ